jgi:hypothetical protein
MKTRSFVVAIASLLLLGPTMAWSQAVVRTLHIEDDPEKVPLVDLKRLGLVHINDTTLKRTPRKSFTTTAWSLRPMHCSVRVS